MMTPRMVVGDAETTLEPYYALEKDNRFLYLRRTSNSYPIKLQIINGTVSSRMIYILLKDAQISASQGR